MTWDGAAYRATEDRAGNITITRKYDGATAFLQGDDTLDLRESLERLEEIDYPSGPFSDIYQHRDVVLDQYDTVMEVNTDCI